VIIVPFLIGTFPYQVMRTTPWAVFAVVLGGLFIGAEIALTLIYRVGISRDGKRLSNALRRDGLPDDHPGLHSPSALDAWCGDRQLTHQQVRDAADREMS